MPKARARCAYHEYQTKAVNSNTTGSMVMNAMRRPMLQLRQNCRECRVMAAAAQGVKKSGALPR